MSCTLASDEQDVEVFNPGGIGETLLQYNLPGGVSVPAGKALCVVNSNPTNLAFEVSARGYARRIERRPRGRSSPGRRTARSRNPPTVGIRRNASPSVGTTVSLTRHGRSTRTGASRFKWPPALARSIFSCGGMTVGGAASANRSALPRRRSRAARCRAGRRRSRLLACRRQLSDALFDGFDA